MRGSLFGVVALPRGIPRVCVCVFQRVGRDEHGERASRRVSRHEAERESSALDEEEERRGGVEARVALGSPLALIAGR